MKADTPGFFPTREQVEEARSVLTFAHSETVNALVPIRGKVSMGEYPVFLFMDMETALAFIDDFSLRADDAFERVDRMLRQAIDRYEGRSEG